MRKYLKSGVFLFCTASLGGAHADCLVDGSNAVSVQATQVRAASPVRTCLLPMGR